MAVILKRLLEGDLNVDEFKDFFKTGNSLKSPVGNDITDNSITEFVPYFLNFIREESSHHFTSDLPVISPKKIKKRKKTSRPRTPSSDTSNESARSSARGSLFSSPPSTKLGNVNMSPVAGGQLEKQRISPVVSPSLKHQSHCSSDGSDSRDVLQVTSTPSKFNLDEDFPPMSSQKESKRKSSTPTRRITPTPARASYPRRPSSSNVFNNSTFETSQESDTSFGSEQSFSSEKSKHRHKFGNMNFGSASPKNARRNSAKLKLEDFMQKGSRNRGKSSGRRQDSCNVDTSSELEKSDISRNSCDISRNSCDVSRNSCNVSRNSNLGKSRDSEMPEKDGCLPFVIPKRDQVTQSQVLQILADVHSFCIRENLVPNIVVELCFILQLLTIEGNENKENGLNSRFLTTVHNCVFYATLVLENVTAIIKLLDKGTLRLLLDNARLNEFSATLKEELNEVYPTISLNKVPCSLVKSPLNSVPFQATVDNRNNFSTDQAFHCFKKQRDTFYEIVREWEEFHSKPGWFLEEKLGNKIRYVVHQKPGLANHSHFARLFQSQLIQMCCYENSLPTFNEGESPEFIGNLFKSNPEKFFRLQQRLVAPLSTTAGPCPPPGFTETEEFFREFIMSAMCPTFNRYLMDSFIAKIIELNKLELTDSLENSLHEQTDEDEGNKFQVKFATCLITLRTLAKFLGFLVFSPYHSSTDLPITVKNNLITARNQVAEQLDIMYHLEKAQKQQRLVLTLPWVIEYLSMVDSVGPYLKYYSKVFEYLHRIYRITLLRKASFDMNRNSLMLSVGLGWLFEIPAIPETMFSKSLGKTFTEAEKLSSSPTLDSMDLVDQHLLYTCCPYLGELRSILAEAVTGKTVKRGSVKKIKPICADKVEVSSSSTRLLQTQLEDNFFRNQPEFLKKIVDFVISRNYHNLVSLVKNSIIPSEIKSAKIKLDVDSVFNSRDWKEVNKEEFKDKNRGLILRLSNETTDKTLQRIANEVDKECKTRSFDAVKSLLPFDMDEMVVKTVAGIVHQSTMDKLMEWSHQNLPGLIEKDVEQDIDKMITRYCNLPVNLHHWQAEDPENSFNWFYQQLIEKAKEAEKQPTTSTNTGTVKSQGPHLLAQGKVQESENRSTGACLGTGGTNEECRQLLGNIKEPESELTVKSAVAAGEIT